MGPIYLPRPLTMPGWCEPGKKKSLRVVFPGSCKCCFSIQFLFLYSFDPQREVRIFLFNIPRSVARCSRGKLPLPSVTTLFLYVFIGLMPSLPSVLNPSEPVPQCVEPDKKASM